MYVLLHFANKKDPVFDLRKALGVTNIFHRDLSVLILFYINNAAYFIPYFFSDSYKDFGSFCWILDLYEDDYYLLF